MRKILLALALLCFSVPSFAADKPLVIESGKIKQLPASTTLQINASGTGAASINIPHGSAPTSPTDGDCWTTTAGLYCRINGVTVSYTSGGSIAVKDEGSTLTSAVTSFDFTGPGVSASTVGSAVTVNISGALGAGGTGTSYEAGPITPPTLASLPTWDNQGTSTASDGTGVMIITPQADNILHGRYMTAPATPYDIYCRVDLETLSTNSVGTAYNAQAGIIFKDTAGDNERVFFGIQYNNDTSSGDDTKLYNALIVRYSGATPPVTGTVPVVKYGFTPWKWIRVNNDGTTLTFYVSKDGKNWISAGTETLAAHIDGAASVGVAAVVASAAGSAVALFSYFSTTSPN